MSGPITFEWQNPNALLRQVRELLQKQTVRFRRIPESAIRNAAFELQALVVQHLPKKTSTLVRSVGVRFERPAEGGFLARIGTHMAYARYIEAGTGVHGPKARPIIIVAKNKKALFWGAKREGKFIFRRRVTIQGMKPRPVWAQQTAAFLPRYEEIIRRELAKEASA